MLERLEAGLVLQGTEVKSLRDGKVVLRDAYARRATASCGWSAPRSSSTPRGTARTTRSRRDRKLLLNHPEIERLASRVAEKGLTVVPLRIYFKEGRAKIEIGLARGKEGIDKRARTSQQRDSQREIERELKARRV